MDSKCNLMRFQNLSAWPGVMHGISDRHVPGNVSFEHGDLNAVLCARGELLGMMNEEIVENGKAQKLAMLVSAWQTHSDHVFVHREGDKLPEGVGMDGEVADVDAFVTDVPGVGFMVKTADCQPILLAGRRQKLEDGSQNGNKGTGGKEPRLGGALVVAIVHSGWRGSLKNIAGKTVRKMVEEFSVDPATIEVGVGPSIGPCCAVFEDESMLHEAMLPGGTDVFKYRIFEAGQPTQYFNFWRMTRDQLMAEGVPDKAMEFCGICTVCHKDRWFSFRGDQPDCGRFGSVIGLIL